LVKDEDHKVSVEEILKGDDFKEHLKNYMVKFSSEEQFEKKKRVDKFSFLISVRRNQYETYEEMANYYARAPVHCLA